MKTLKTTLLILISGLLLHGCYEPLELNTDNLTKAEVPIKLGLPLVDGMLTIDYDSLINVEDMAGGFIQFIDDQAYLTFDTIYDFYDQLSQFLDATDIDFGSMTNFSQSFDMKMEVEPSPFNVKASLPGSGVVDSLIPVAVADTFIAKYGGNAIFFDAGGVSNLKIDGLNVDKAINMGLGFKIYKVEFKSGKIVIELTPANFQQVDDDSLSISPSFHYQDATYDTLITNTRYYEIMKTNAGLPDSVWIKTEIDIPSIKDPQGNAFDLDLYLPTLDTTVVIDLAGYYYSDATGAGDVEIKIANWTEINNPISKAVIPLPDTLYFDATIEDLEFQKAEFDYGLDTMVNETSEMPLDYLENLPEGLDINGFYIADPFLKIKVRSNLGFGAQLSIDSLLFETGGAPELITNDGKAVLNIYQADDPAGGINEAPVAKDDSLVIDSTTSRIGDIDLFSVNNLKLNYAIIVNPEVVNRPAYNFIYLYDDAVEESMYDVKLTVEALIPLAFKFNYINFSQTIASPLKENELDSAFYLADDDTVKLEVMLATRDFPFEMKTQFYFEGKDSNGSTLVLDSMFNEQKTIIPSSTAILADSAKFALAINNSNFDAIQNMDSIRISFQVKMDNNTLYQVQKGGSTEIGYRFNLANSSVTIKND